ncbi:MAG TPA: tetratricopeptide repeat protein [Crinalium sp.]
MLKDAQGLTVSTGSREAIAAVDRFCDQALYYGKDAETAILSSIAYDPTWGLAHAYAAAHYLSGESYSTRQQASLHLKAAQQYQATATERETLYINGILAWAARDVDTAIAYHEAIATQFPQDLMAVQQAQYHYFYRGDSDRLLAIAERVRPANPDNHYLYGMIAFGLEQCHQLEASEAMGRHATAMNRRDPWAHHAVAHVLETQGRFEEGIAWMESLSDTWDSCNTMLYTHNWWHVALYYIAKGDAQQVLHLYDTHVWGRANQSSPKEQVGAIATLLRLNLKDIGVSNRWHALIPHLTLRLHEHALPFQDLHYVYALAKAGQTDLTQTMLWSMQAHAQTLPPNQRSTWLEIALPAAKGMVAHAKRDWLTAIAYLKPVLPHLWKLGGSHAQRHLFEQIYQDALRQPEQRSSILLNLRPSAVA